MGLRTTIRNYCWCGGCAVLLCWAAVPGCAVQKLAAKMPGGLPGLPPGLPGGGGGLPPTMPGLPPKLPGGPLLPGLGGGKPPGLGSFPGFGKKK